MRSRGSSKSVPPAGSCMDQECAGACIATKLIKRHSDGGRAWGEIVCVVGCAGMEVRVEVRVGVRAVMRAEET